MIRRVDRLKFYQLVTHGTGIQRTIVDRQPVLWLLAAPALPALSGLAKLSQVLGNQEYLAGIWKDSILRDLVLLEVLRTSTNSFEILVPSGHMLKTNGSSSMKSAPTWPLGTLTSSSSFPRWR
jgi:hypothetical protein